MPLRETQRPAHRVAKRREHHTITPLLPWTQAKPTLPLDVLDSFNSTQVSHAYAVDVRVSVCGAPRSDLPSPLLRLCHGSAPLEPPIAAIRSHKNVMGVVVQGKAAMGRQRQLNRQQMGHKTQYLLQLAVSVAEYLCCNLSVEGVCWRTPRNLASVDRGSGHMQSWCRKCALSWYAAACGASHQGRLC